jgi:outer membrane immunogenic protein
MPSKMKFVVEAIGQQPLQKFTKLVTTLLLGVTGWSSLATAQHPSKNFQLGSPVAAVTYDLERAKTAATGGSGFWLQGGSVDLAIPFYKGLSLAGSFGGTQASNIQPGANLSKLTYLAGPRYTFGGPHIQIFGEGLFGGVHAFDGIFPATGGVISTANSYAMQIGGGLDVPLQSGFGLRVLDVDYVRTALPNNGTNSQNDLRLSFGLSYHFNRK